MKLVLRLPFDNRRLGCSLNVYAKSFEPALRASVEAAYSTSGCRELERLTFLLPVRAKGVPVTEECKRSDDESVVAIVGDVVAYVPFHASEVLVRLEIELDMQNRNQSSIIAAKSFHEVPCLSQKCEQKKRLWLLYLGALIIRLRGHGRVDLHFPVILLVQHRYSIHRVAVPDNHLNDTVHAGTHIPGVAVDATAGPHLHNPPWEANGAGNGVGASNRDGSKDTLDGVAAAVARGGEECEEAQYAPFLVR